MGMALIKTLKKNRMKKIRNLILIASMIMLWGILPEKSVASTDTKMLLIKVGIG